MLTRGATSLLDLPDNLLVDIFLRSQSQPKDPHVVDGASPTDSQPSVALAAPAPDAPGAAAAAAPPITAQARRLCLLLSCRRLFSLLSRSIEQLEFEENLRSPFLSLSPPAASPSLRLLLPSLSSLAFLPNSLLALSDRLLLSLARSTAAAALTRLVLLPQPSTGSAALFSTSALAALLAACPSLAALTMQVPPGPRDALAGSIAMLTALTRVAVFCGREPAGGHAATNQRGEEEEREEGAALAVDGAGGAARGTAAAAGAETGAPSATSSEAASRSSLFSSLSRLPQLQHLEVRSSDLRDSDYLACLPRCSLALTRLEIGGLLLFSLPPWPSQPSLCDLSLSSPLLCLPSLPHLPRLTSLSLNVSDADPAGCLPSCPSLLRLSLTMDHLPASLPHSLSLLPLLTVLLLLPKYLAQLPPLSPQHPLPSLLSLRLTALSLQPPQLASCLAACPSLTRLHMERVSSIALPASVAPLASLQCLLLDRCEFSDAGTLPPSPPSLSFLPLLTRLSIKSCPSLSSLPLSPISLPFLKQLLISDCSSLRSLPASLSSLSSLSLLQLVDCPSLRRMPPLSLLSALQEVVVTRCPAVQGCGEEDATAQADEGERCRPKRRSVRRMAPSLGSCSDEGALSGGREGSAAASSQHGRPHHPERVGAGDSTQPGPAWEPCAQQHPPAALLLLASSFPFETPPPLPAAVPATLQLRRCQVDAAALWGCPALPPSSIAAPHLSSLSLSSHLPEGLLSPQQTPALQQLELKEIPQMDLPLSLFLLSRLSSLSLLRCRIPSLPPVLTRLQGLQELRLEGWRGRPLCRWAVLQRLPRLRRLTLLQVKVEVEEGGSIEEQGERWPGFGGGAGGDDSAVGEGAQAEEGTMVQEDDQGVEVLENASLSPEPMEEQTAAEHGTPLESAAPLPALESLHWEQVRAQQVPPSLRRLSRLHSLLLAHCPPAAAQHLPLLRSLQSLSLHSVPQLRSLPPSLSLLLRLSSLTLRDLPHLQALPPSSSRLPSLRQLALQRCPQLALRPEVLVGLQLQLLEVEGCPRAEGAAEELRGEVDLVQIKRWAWGVGAVGGFQETGSWEEKTAHQSRIAACGSLSTFTV